jgi:hypothetical protein
MIDVLPVSRIRSSVADKVTAKERRNRTVSTTEAYVDVTSIPTNPTDEELQAKVIESIGGYFGPQEVPFGVVYRWHSGYVLLECGCSERLILTCSMTTCSECGADHAAIVQEALAGQCSEDEALHPWRYAGEREGLGLPY